MLQCLLYYFGRLNKVPMIKFVIAEVIDYMVEFAGHILKEGNILAALEPASRCYIATENENVSAGIFDNRRLAKF